MRRRIVLVGVLACGLARAATAQGSSSAGPKPAAPPSSIIPTSAIPPKPVIGSIIPESAIPPAKPDPGITLSIQPEIAGFSLAGRRDYENPADGVQLRYARADSLSIAVTVYAGPDLGARCDLACAQQAMDGEFTQLRASVAQLVDQGIMRTVSIKPDEPLAPPAGAAWRIGRHVSFTMTSELGEERSEFYLFYVPGFRVKVRSTFAERDDRSAALVRFAGLIVAALTSR